MTHRSNKNRAPLAKALKLTCAFVPMAVLSSHTPTVAQITAAPAASQPNQLSQAERDTINAQAQLTASLKRIAANGGDASALIDAGNAALTLDDANAAMGFFNRANGLWPNNPRILAGMGASLVRLENPSESLRLFQLAAKNGPIDRSYLTDRGLAYDLSGDNARAQQDYQAALQSSYSDRTLRLYALSIGIAGDTDKAVQTIAPLLQKKDRAAWRDRAFILAMNGRTSEALEIVKTTMPANVASGITPYLMKMNRLSNRQLAAAVHYGQFPTSDTQLAAVGRGTTASATQPPAATAKAATPAKGRRVAAAKPQVQESNSSGPRFVDEDGRSVKLSKSEQRRLIAEHEAKKKAEAEAAAKAETERLAEAKRQEEATRLAEQQRQAEATRLAEQQRQAEAARLAEAKRQEEIRIAGEQRQAEQARLAEARRQEETRQAEAAKLAAAQTAASQTAPAATATPDPVQIAAASPLGPGFAPNATTSATPPTSAATAEALGPGFTPSPQAAVAPPQPSTPGSYVGPIDNRPTTVAAVTPAPTSPAPTSIAPTTLPPSNVAASTQPTPTVDSASMAASNVAASGSAVVDAAATSTGETVKAFSLADLVQAVHPPEAVPQRNEGYVDIATLDKLRADKLAADREAAAKAKAEAEKKRLAEAKAAKDKEAAEAKAKEAEEKKKASAPKIWAQIATATGTNRFTFDLRKAKARDQALFKGKDGFRVETGRMSRLVIGPFASVKEANDWLTKYRKAGGEGFAWTSRGEEAVPVPK